MNFAASQPAFRRAICFACLLLGAAPLPAVDDTTTRSPQPLKTAQFQYLAPGRPDVAILLPPPPATGSMEQAADLDEVRVVYHAASSNDMAAAYGEKKFTVFNFTGAAGPFFVETNLPRTAAFFQKVQKDAATATDLGKDHFQRPRPYTVDPSLANGKLEKSFSYPSGHSTESMVLALVLADLLPEQRAAILEFGRAMGWRRVEIARHYPTDIHAGRVLAQAIVQEMKNNPDFQRDLAEVREEISAARASARN